MEYKQLGYRIILRKRLHMDWDIDQYWDKEMSIFEFLFLVFKLPIKKNKEMKHVLTYFIKAQKS